MERNDHPLPPQDQLAAADALYRFAAGQDWQDMALLASAFTDDAELDFVQPAAKLGAAIQPFVGRAQIVARLQAAIDRLHTTHSVSNPRAMRAGDEVAMTAVVEALHVLRTDPGRHLLLKNLYRLRLRCDDAGTWRIARMHIHNVWLSGDPAVLFGAG